MGLTGTLKDFSVTDILQLIGQQSKSGVLHLKNDEGEEIHISFHQGAVVGAEHVSRNQRDLLGRMLVRARLISEHQLTEALETQKRTLRRLGDILVEEGALSREDLREMTQLQITETLSALFYWKRGAYEFEAKSVYWDPDSVTPLRSEAVLMDGFRMVDEWPLVRKKIVSAKSTFLVLEPLPDPGPTAPSAESSFADLMDEDDGEIGATERRIMGLVEPGRTVEELVDLSRLGAFETWKALATLVDLGHLRQIVPDATEETPGELRKRRRAIGRHLASAAYGLLGVGLIVGSVALATSRAPDAFSPLRKDHDARVAAAQRDRLQFASEVFRKEQGRAPSSLDELLGAGLLSAAEPAAMRQNGVDLVVLPSSISDAQEIEAVDGDKSPRRIR